MSPYWYLFSFLPAHGALLNLLLLNNWVLYRNLGAEWTSH